VLQSLLPVLDDLDRAREHGDLNGPFASVADQLSNALTKHGLEAFGVKGDPFDPQIHEAVAHMQMPGVDGPTCIDVMRSGYRLGDKLLRPALVAVAEPSDEPEPVQEPAPEEESQAPEAAVTEGTVEEGTVEEGAVVDGTVLETEVLEGEAVEADAEASGETEPVEADEDETETVATAEAGAADSPGTTESGEDSAAEAAADEEPEASDDAEPKGRKKKK
jgi:molecular chaperone GrpE